MTLPAAGCPQQQEVNNCSAHLILRSSFNGVVLHDCQVCPIKDLVGMLGTDCSGETRLALHLRSS